MTLGDLKKLIDEFEEAALRVAMSDRDAEPTRAVVDGVLQYTSPSQIQTADPQTFGGCFRKWFFDKVVGVERSESKAQAIGKKIHGELEHTLKTGEDVRGTIARTANEYVRRLAPYPRPTLLIEHPIAHVKPDGSVAGMLKIGGLPVLGYIDVVDVEPRVPRVIDWKTTAKIENAKQAHELGDTVQMSAYGEWLFLAVPAAQQVELGHVTMSTTSNVDAVGSFGVVDRERVRRRLALAEPVVHTIRDLARETDPARAPANPSACGAYGGCPYLTRCPRTAADTLATTVGRIAAMSLTQALPPSFIPGVTPITPPAGVGFSIDALQAAAQPPAPSVDPAFAQAIGIITEIGQRLGAEGGFPEISGTAAAPYAALRGLAQAPGFAGSGPFGGLKIPDVQTAIRMAEGMAKHFGPPPAAAPAPVSPPAAPPQPAWAPPGVQAALPPDAPASNPALAADPVAGWVPPQAAPAPVVAAPAPVAPPTPPGPVAPPPADAPKRGRGRPKKEPATTPAQAAASAAGLAEAPELELWLDCRPAAGALEAFDPAVIGLVRHLETQFQVEDLRTAPADGPLGYGRWKGVVAAMTREAVAKGTIPAAAYFVDTRSEFAAVMAEALADHVVARGVR